MTWCLFTNVISVRAVRKLDNLWSWSYTIFCFEAVPGKNIVPFAKAYVMLTVRFCKLDHLFIFWPYHHRVLLRRAVSKMPNGCCARLTCHEVPLCLTHRYNPSFSKKRISYWRLRGTSTNYRLLNSYLYRWNRLRMNQQGIETHEWKWDHVKEACLDIKSFFWFALMFSIS